MRSVMQHQFSQVPRAEIPRSSFNRSHGYKSTFNAGYLIPFLVDEVLPGDTFNLRSTLFARMATPIFPIMDNMMLTTFFFFVPDRLVWNNFERFMGAQDNPGDSTDFLIPEMVSPDGGFGALSLADYFGIPPSVKGLKVSALPFRKYNLIYNEWFRDQNLIDSVEVPKDDGPDDPAIYNILRRVKRSDYFTSCLPWPQKGPAVDLPLGTRAPLAADLTAGGQQTFYTGGISGYASTFIIGEKPVVQGSDMPVYADLTQAAAATINSLREAFQVQRFYERCARGGTRYKEILEAHWGVISPDFRLQRPEYLGGGTTFVNISPVQQTSASVSGSPQGNLAAYGTISAHNHGFTKSFVEHGHIIGLVHVGADLTYQQGLNRMWSRRTMFDMYWPVFAHLGEQPVYNKEIYAQGNDDDDKVFGYQERGAEYRYYASLITGKFRSTDPQPLDSWHLSQKFENLPTLSQQFKEDYPPIDRVVAIIDEPHFLLDCYHQMICARAMPVYAVPGLIDHM